MFSKKLDFLLSLTNTKNSSLAKSLNYDPSYISRIRTGKRGIPHNAAFFEMVSAFFSRNISNDYQKKSAAEVICPGKEWPSDVNQAEQLLAIWLSSEDTIDNYFTEDLLHKILLNNTPKTIPNLLDESITIPDINEKISFFYGRQGKREAVISFLTPLAHSGKPHTLLLFSDEDFSWLYEKSEFAKRWLILLSTIIKNGGNIRIIHSVSRGIGDMLEAVQKWIPVYATGAIEPYYYPRIRDGIYHRTLFIAKGISAISSNSVTENDEGKVNILIRDSKAVDALEMEYNDYLSLCRPLMKIFTNKTALRFWDIESELFSRSGNLLCYGTLFIERNQIKSLIEKSDEVTEILYIPEIQMILNDKTPVPFKDFDTKLNEFATASEYINKLKEVIKLAKSRQNYHLILINQSLGDIIFQIKEDYGVIFSRSTPPTTAFFITESNMCMSIADYFSRLVEHYKTEDTIPKLEKIIETLEEHINS